MRMNNIWNRVTKRVRVSSTITMMSLASLMAVVTFGRCIFFLGEGNKSDDVNEESIMQLKQYMKELRSIN